MNKGELTDRGDDARLQRTPNKVLVSLQRQREHLGKQTHLAEILRVLSGHRSIDGRERRQPFDAGRDILSHLFHSSLSGLYRW